MTAEQKIEHLKKKLKKHDLTKLTKDEFDQEFEDQRIVDLREEMWECYCILSDVTSVLWSETEKECENVAHWIKTPKAVMGEGYMWYCDNCEHQVYQDSSRNYPDEKYCPNCGRRMKEENT